MKFPRKGAIVRPQKNPIEWRVNVTQLKRPDGSALDGTDADELSAGEIEGRRQAMAFFDFLKREAPGFGNAYIVDTPPQLGIRETRRITGRYQLSRRRRARLRELSRHHRRQRLADREARRGRRRVAVAGHSRQSRGFNHLPYRMLLPQKVDNLLVAGRCASMTHEGQSAARVSGACFVMGQAAGSGRASRAVRQLRARPRFRLKRCRLCLRRTASISGATSNSCNKRNDMKKPSHSR